MLIGIDDAACSLNVSREALTLELARADTPTDAEIDAVREGLLSAVSQMQDDGSLPPASELVDEALDSADLNPLLESAIRAIPDSVIDAALKTDDVLTRAISDLDLRTCWRTSMTSRSSTTRSRQRSPKRSRTPSRPGSAT